MYYIAGGVLTVAYLGAGSAWMLLPRRGRDVVLGGLAVATIAAVVTVLLAPVDVPGLAAAHSGEPPKNGDMNTLPGGVSPTGGAMSFRIG